MRRTGDYSGSQGATSRREMAPLVPALPREQEAKRFAVEAASARDRARVQIDEVLRADPELLDELLACRAKNAKITT